MKKSNRRIEPSFNGNINISEQYQQSYEQNTQYEYNNTEQPNEYETQSNAALVFLQRALKISTTVLTILKNQLIKLYQQYPKPFMITAASLALVILLWFTFSGEETSNTEQTAEADKPVAVITNTEIIKNNEVTLPDNFSLSTNNHDALTLYWPSNTSSAQSLWNISTAVGNPACANITFNNNASYRTIDVAIVDGQYTATFSPLDSDEIILNIAKKSSFSLCDVDFSLKGTQAILAKIPRYLSVIE